MASLHLLTEIITIYSVIHDCNSINSLFKLDKFNYNVLRVRFKQQFKIILATNYPMK